MFCFHDSSLLGYGSVTGRVFSDILMKTVWPRRCRLYSLPNCQKLFNQLHTITSWEVWIQSKAAVTTAYFSWTCSSINFFYLVYLMMPIAETVYCWMIGWTVKVRNLFIWYILVGGHEKRIVLLCGCCWWLGRNALHEAGHTGSPFKFIWQCVEHFKTNY